MPSMTSEGRGIEGIKFLVDLAVRSGRARLRDQTGYVHLCYHAHPKEPQETIPLVENFLYALALLRSKTSEQVLEARDLIEKLLHFQTEGGGFPLYLHQYPTVYDHLIGGTLLPVFYWSLVPFHKVLGQSVRDRLELAIEHLMELSLERTEVLERTPMAGVKIAASAVALGRWMKKDPWVSRGEALLEKWGSQASIEQYTPAGLGDHIVAMQLLDPKLESDRWRSWLHEALPLWDAKRSCYAGPAVGIWQLGLEPEPSLFDLFMSYYHGEYGARVLLDHNVHLQGALLQPVERLEEAAARIHQQNGTLCGAPWHMETAEDASFSLLSQTGDEDSQSKWPTYPLQILWGDREAVHSAVMQVSRTVPVIFEEQGRSLTIELELPAEEDPEDRKKNREFQLFIDAGTQVEWTVNGVKANTFQMGETVAWRSAGWTAELICEQIEGDGAFFGHIMMGNRSGQRLNKGSYRHDAYDWVLFLRRTRVHGPCKIRVKMNLGGSHGDGDR